MSAERLWLDPTHAAVWDPACEPELRRARRTSRVAWAIALLMGAVTGVVALRAGLRIRDTDNMLGPRTLAIAALVGGFFFCDIVPRAVRRARARGMALRAATSEVARERWSRRRLAAVAGGLSAFYLTYLSYRNLKGFLPALVQQDEDLKLLGLEREVFGGDPASALHDLLGTGVAAHVLSGAYLFYLAFIPLSLGIMLILSINPVPGMLWVTALGINWPLGVATYYLLPSLGPVFVTPEMFSALPATGVSALQQELVDHRQAVLANPYTAEVVQSIAAFASLHVSVVFSAAIVAQALRVPRALRVGLWVFLGLTLLSTVYFGWHYVVDDLAGLAIGAFAVWVAAALTGHRRVLPALNLPNAITLARLLLVPVVVAVVLQSRDGSLLAVALFAAIAASDALDGHLARARGEVTTLGKVLDPLADKLLVISVLASLAMLGRLAVWVVAIVFFREAAVTVMRAFAGRRGVVVPASPLGKAKMAAQVLLVLVVLAVEDPAVLWVQAIVLGAVALTLASAADYAMHFRSRIDDALAATR